MNTNMKTLQILIVLFIVGSLSAQTITGKVKDKIDFIPFANVILKDNNSKILSGTTTDDNGAFELIAKKGSYILEVSFLGYKTLTKTIQVNGNLALGTLVLEENSQALSEVVIKTGKRVLERIIDRLVFNVEKSIAATGGNDLDNAMKAAARSGHGDVTEFLIRSGANNDSDFLNKQIWR